MSREQFVCSHPTRPSNVPRMGRLSRIHGLVRGACALTPEQLYKFLACSTAKAMLQDKNQTPDLTKDCMIQIMPKGSKQIVTCRTACVANPELSRRYNQRTR